MLIYINIILTTFSYKGTTLAEVSIKVLSGIFQNSDHRGAMEVSNLWHPGQKAQKQEPEAAVVTEYLQGLDDGETMSWAGA